MDLLIAQTLVLCTIKVSTSQTWHLELLWQCVQWACLQQMFSYRAANLTGAGMVQTGPSQTWWKGGGSDSWAFAQPSWLSRLTGRCGTISEWGISERRGNTQRKFLHYKGNHTELICTEAIQLWKTEEVAQMATLGKLLRDRVKHTWAFSGTSIPPWAALKWSKVNRNTLSYLGSQPAWCGWVCEPGPAGWSPCTPPLSGSCRSRNPPSSGCSRSQGWAADGVRCCRHQPALLVMSHQTCTQRMDCFEEGGMHLPVQMHMHASAHTHTYTHTKTHTHTYTHRTVTDSGGGGGWRREV